MMKWGPIEPREGEWQWTGPDRLVEFGAAHGMTVVGHTLVWHSQTPRWLFVDEQNAPVSKERLLKRIETHIQTLVGRYKGRVAIWDVVNEAIDEDEKGWRQSPFLTIAGPEFVERAFRLAHEADPKATLLYNDYNEHNPGRRRFLVEVIRDYKRRGVPIHGVGFQGHVGLEYPDLAEYEKSLQAIAAEGLPVHITELDVDVLPRASGYTGAEISTNFELSEKLNPWKTGLPAEIDAKLTARYRQLFELFLKYRETIARVSTWGTFDGESWKNNFPVRGRTNYPLLFDRALQPKAAYARRAERRRLTAAVAVARRRYCRVTLVARTLPSAWVTPLTLTLFPLFSSPHAGVKVVDAVVATLKPLTPNVTVGQVPFRPPTLPSISNSAPVASSLICSRRASIDPSDWRSPTTWIVIPICSTDRSWTSPRRWTTVDPLVRTVVPAMVSTSAGRVPPMAVSVPSIEADVSCGGVGVSAASAWSAPRRPGSRAGARRTRSHRAATPSPRCACCSSPRRRGRATCWGARRTP